MEAVHVSRLNNNEFIKNGDNNEQFSKGIKKIFTLTT